jgi:chemotaxis response regulator CheB
VLRVLIADLPDLQADVLTALVDAEPDMLVVGRGVRHDGVLRSIEALTPDVVVMPPTHGDDDADTLVGLAAWPNVGVIVFNETSGTIVQIAVVPEGDSWPARVVATIRAAAPQQAARHRLNADRPS